MKLVKMSLVASLLVGSTLLAVENVEYGGDANLFYTTSSKGDLDLFEKDASAADASLNLFVGAELLKNDAVSVKGKASYTVVSTLGLENNFVSNVWGGSHTATVPTGASYGSALGGAKVENANYFTEAYLTVQAGKTALQLGRMELDTPLAFTEAWSIEKNTFEAAVVMNTDIPDTTIVGAYVGNGNGTETFGEDATSNVYALGLAAGGVVNGEGKFATFGTDGAYAIGVINNSFKPLTAQAWYYNVTNLVKAYWLQADIDCSLVEGVKIGGQYTAHDPQEKLKAIDPTAKESNVYAVMLGYEMKDTFFAKVAYSKVDDDYRAGFNTATATGTAQSKLYTEAWWMYGEVTRAGAEAMNLTLEAPIAGIFDLGFYGTMVDHANGNDLREVTITASKSFGPLDTSLAYVNYEYKNGDPINLAQAYLTLNF